MKAVVVSFPIPQEHQMYNAFDDYYVVRGFLARGFEVERLSTLSGLSKKDFLTMLTEQATKDQEDLFALYVSGHGTHRGIITYIEEGGREIVVTPEELFDTLKYREGPTFLLLDVCHSGVFTDYLKRRPQKSTVVWASAKPEDISLAPLFPMRAAALLLSDEPLDLSKPPQKVANRWVEDYATAELTATESLVTPDMAKKYYSDLEIYIHSTAKMVLFPRGTQPPFTITDAGWDADPDIKYVLMSEGVYEELKKEAKTGLAENAGMLIGSYEKEYVIVSNFIRFPFEWVEEYGSKRPLWKKVVGTPYGVELASDLVDKHVADAKSPVVGFYHSHPNMTDLSPNDKRELLKAREFSHLTKPSALHVLTRLHGYEGGLGFSLLGAAKPTAFARRGVQIVEIPIKVLKYEEVSRALLSGAVKPPRAAGAELAGNEQAIAEMLVKLDSAMKKSRTTEEKIDVLREVVRAETLYADIDTMTSRAWELESKYRASGRLDPQTLFEEEKKVVALIKELTEKLRERERAGDKGAVLQTLLELAKLWQVYGDLKKVARALAQA